MKILSRIALGMLLASSAAAQAATQTPAAQPPQTPAGMTAAVRASSKIGAPVDVYYRHLAGAKLAADPSLQLTVVPRVAGNLRVEIVADKSVSVVSGGAPLALQKAGARTQYNRLLSLRRSGDAAASVRAIVWLESDGARLFSVFVIPADAASAAMQRKSAGKPPAADRQIRQQ